MNTEGSPLEYIYKTSRCEESDTLLPPKEENANIRKHALTLHPVKSDTFYTEVDIEKRGAIIPILKTRNPVNDLKIAMGRGPFLKLWSVLLPKKTCLLFSIDFLPRFFFYLENG